MVKNKPLIDEVIELQKKDNNMVKEIAIRNKASPLDEWEGFMNFSQNVYVFLFRYHIDGIKLKFQHTTVTFNGRHKSK